MSAAANEAELRAGFETARSRAERFSGSAAILPERYISRARHVEVQIPRLNDSRVVALGERDCSVRRRHQKVAEELPRPRRGSVMPDRRAQDQPGVSRGTAGQRRVRQRVLRYVGRRAAAMMSMMMAQPRHRSPGNDARRCA